MSRTSHRASRDNHAHHAQHEGDNGLWSCGSRQGRRREECPIPRELGRAAPVGEEPEVADPDEARGEDVQEEPAEPAQGSAMSVASSASQPLSHEIFLFGAWRG